MLLAMEGGHTAKRRGGTMQQSKPNATPEANNGLLADKW